MSLVKKYPEYYSETFMDCIVVDSRAAPHGPIRLGMFISGNGVTDEIQVDIEREEDAWLVEVSSRPERITLRLEKYGVFALSDTREPGVLYLVNRHFCTKKTFKETDPYSKPTIEPLSHFDCLELFKDLRVPPPMSIAKEKIKKQKKDKNPTFEENGEENGETPTEPDGKKEKKKKNHKGKGHKEKGLTEQERKEKERKKLLRINNPNRKWKDHAGLTHVKQKYLPGPGEERQEDSADSSEQDRERVTRRKALVEYNDENDKRLQSCKDSWGSEQFSVGPLLRLTGATRWQLYEGINFLYGTLIEKKETFVVLGIYVIGNGIEDVIRWHVESEDYALQELRVFEDPERIIFYLPYYERELRTLAMMSKLSQPGRLVETRHQKCTVRSYQANPRLEPSTETIDWSGCKLFRDEINEVVVNVFYPANSRIQTPAKNLNLGLS